MGTGEGTWAKGLFELACMPRQSLRESTAAGLCPFTFLLTLASHVPTSSPPHARSVPISNPARRL